MWKQMIQPLLPLTDQEMYHNEDIKVSKYSRRKVLEKCESALGFVLQEQTQRQKQSLHEKSCQEALLDILAYICTLPLDL